MAKGIGITKKSYLEEPRLKKKDRSITTQSRTKRLGPIAAEVTIYVLVILFFASGTYWRNKTWNSEMELFADCVKKSPNKDRPHNNLGTAFGHLGRHQEAIPHFNEALRINPNYAEAHYNLGNVFVRLGKYQEAVAQYTEALRINPRFAEAHANLGIAYFMMGNRSSALKEYEVLKTMNPGLADALYEKMK
jgi:tetratricopeptide (TPR) repeat protein